MKSESLVLHCLARRDRDVWVVICVDFDLAAQAESLELAKYKLDEQIKEYLIDVLCGEDREHSFDLLGRKSPLKLRLAFWFYANIVSSLKTSSIANFIKNRFLPSGFNSFSFYEPLPMVPAAVGNKNC